MIQCKENQENKIIEKPRTFVEVPIEDETFTVPDKDEENVKYEYRTGNSGNYEYNYDVEGYDNNGDYVSGNVDISSNDGEGYISNDNGEDISITVEWSGYGEIEGTDDDGNTYNLTIN